MLSVSTQIAHGEDLLQFERMLQSVKDVDEIRVYNYGRTDKLLYALCIKYQAQIINVPEPYPRIVEYIREREVKDTKYDWVLVLDYDEVVTACLLTEIKNITKNNHADSSAYAIPRRNYSLGLRLRYGGFGDDYVIRLFYKPDFINWPKEIHSTPIYHGRLSKLTSVLKHDKDASLSQMIQKTDRYTTVEAMQFYEGNTKLVTPITLLRKTLMEFLRRYIIKLGFLDGEIGVIQAIYQSYSIFLRYAKLSELQNNNLKPL